MATTAPIVKNESAAHDLLRQAHESGYRFPSNFSGFVAGIDATESSTIATSAMTGTVEVKGPRDTEITSDGDEDLVSWAQHEVASMAGHRWPTPYEEGDGRWTLTVDEGDESVLGQLIAVHDDPFTSRYRIRDGRISQVIRTMGPTSFTISMLTHQKTDKGTLPESFTVSFWDDEGQLTRSDAYFDTYSLVDDVWIPSSRRVLTATNDGIVGRELVLSNVRLR